MHKIVFEAEVEITEEEMQKLIKRPQLVWDVDNAILQVFGKDVFIKRARIVVEDEAFTSLHVVEVEP